MSPRRPPRAWIGEAKPVDLGGPRGLTRQVLDEEPQADEPLDKDEAFYWSLFTEERKARIVSVIGARLKSITVVLDRLIDPHNVAAILRTSEGLGISRVLIVPHPSADKLAHRRVTQDAEKWLDLDVLESVPKLPGMFAGHLDDKAILYTDLPADRPLALVFGNEHEGPSAETLQQAEGTFRIPMAGFTQSFNVSVAAGMTLAHVTRARREYLKASGDLTPEERVVLKRRFTFLAAKLARRLRK